MNPEKGDGRMCVDINECTGFLSGSNMPCDENAKDGFGNNSKTLSRMLLSLYIYNLSDSYHQIRIILTELFAIILLEGLI